MAQTKPLSITAVIAVLSPVIALAAASTDFYLPSLPSIAREFAAEASTVQLTLSVFLYGFAAAQLIYGPLSDRFGRVPVMTAGLLLYVGAGIAATFAASIEQLIAFRFIQALGACAGPVIGRAMVRDLYGNEIAARVYAYLAMTMALTPMIGPIIGGFLESNFGWRANLLLMAAIGAVGLLGVRLKIAETNRVANPVVFSVVRLTRIYRYLLTRPDFLGYAFSSGMSFAGVFAYISAAPFLLMQGYGVSPEGFGLWFALIAVGYGSGSFAAARIVGRLGLGRSILLGVAIVLLASLALCAFAWTGQASPASVTIPVAVIAFGTGLIMPNCQSGCLIPFPQFAGSASAMMGFLQTMTSSTVGVIVGLTLDGTERPIAYATLLCAFALIALYFGLIRPNARRLVHAGAP